MTEGPRYLLLASPARVGSTWLHRYLGHRTDAAISAIKEFHYWDLRPEAIVHRGAEAQAARVKTKRADLRDRIEARCGDTGAPPPARQLERLAAYEIDDDAAYAGFFDTYFAPGQTRVDLTPGMAFLPETLWDRIAALPGDVRILTLLRNPVDHFISHAAHRVVRILETDMSDLPRVASALFANAATDDRAARFMMPTPEDLDRITARFGPDRHLVRFTEDLFSDRQSETLKEICDFAGIAQTSTEAFDFTGNKNTYPPATDHQRRKLTQLFAGQFRYAEARVGRLPPSWQADRDAYL